MQQVIPSKLKTDIMMMLVPIFWALTFPFIHVSVQTMSPETFVFWRFSLAALILLPFIVTRLPKINLYIISWACVLGLLNGGTFIFQTIGLETISSARAAFITGSSVILVPVISFILRLGDPSKNDFFFAVLCLLGLYILTGASFSALSAGDYWVGMCALSTALSIILIQKVTPNVSDILLFTFLQILFTVPCCLVSQPKILDTAILQNYFVLGSIIFCALFATAIALLIQANYQKYMSEFRAAIIFTTEPVYATAFSYFFFKEMINFHIVAGGIIILASVVLSEYFNFMNRKSTVVKTRSLQGQKR
jgi:drug/metabolite transporter (DMT)-like permease